MLRVAAAAAAVAAAGVADVVAAAADGAAAGDGLVFGWGTACRTECHWQSE